MNQGNETIGFIGLGRLGTPMAQNLIERGHRLRVYNRTASKAEPLVARGAELAARPADVVTPGGTVITLLWDDASVESVVTSEGFLERLGPGGLHVSMTTVSPEAARRVAALHARHGSIYVEATVFGRPEAAAARELWIPMAGVDEGKARARPLLEAMGAKGVFDFGEAAGAAAVVKLAGNFLIISAARSLGEALTVVEKSGVDPKSVVEMLTSTLFPAPIYASYGTMFAEKKQSFAASKIPEKDLGSFTRTADALESPTPIANRLLELVKT